MQPRRFYLLIGLVLATVGVGFGLYILFFREIPEEPGVITTPETPIGGLPTAGTGGPQPTTPGTVTPTQGLPPGVSATATGGVTVVTPIAAVPTSGATLTGSSVSFYNRTEGKFYRIDNNGDLRSLSDKTFRNVSDVSFDPQGSKAIMEFPDGSNIIYDFTANKQVTLPSHWEDFRFGPTGSEFVAKSIGSNPSSNFLVLANSDGTNARAIQELGANADKVFPEISANNQVIATALTGEFSGPDARELFFIGKNNENFKSMTIEGVPGTFIPQWSPSGSRLLYSSASAASDYKPLLTIVDGSGDSIGKNKKSLTVNTWADKCTFGATDDVLFCAVPSSLERGSGLQRAVAANTPDNIVKIDTTTGLQSRIAIPEGQKTISKMMLSSDGRSLIFVDALTGSLNKIQLAP